MGIRSHGACDFDSPTTLTHPPKSEPERYHSGSPGTVSGNGTPYHYGTGLLHMSLKHQLTGPLTQALQFVIYKYKYKIPFKTCDWVCPCHHFQKLFKRENNCQLRPLEESCSRRSHSATVWRSERFRYYVFALSPVCLIAHVIVFLWVIFCVVHNIS